MLKFAGIYKEDFPDYQKIATELQTWLRSTMNQERFNALALMHINNDLRINNEEIENEFARNNKTQMAFKNILDDDEK